VYAPSTLKASRPAAVPIRRPATARGIPHYAAENFPALGTILDLKIRVQLGGVPRARPRNAATLRIHPLLHALLRVPLPAHSHAFPIRARVIHAHQMLGCNSAPHQLHASASAQPTLRHPKGFAPGTSREILPAAKSRYVLRALPARWNVPRQGEVKHISKREVRAQNVHRDRRRVCRHCPRYARDRHHYRRAAQIFRRDLRQACRRATDSQSARDPRPVFRRSMDEKLPAKTSPAPTIRAPLKSIHPAAVRGQRQNPPLRTHLEPRPFA
jgi:hypothetical protein